MFQAEADGLDFLRIPEGPKIPRILGLVQTELDPSFLLLEAVKVGRPTAQSEVRMGEALATLHTQTSETRFGYPESNFIGTLEQKNDWMDCWAEFFVEQRLWPQMGKAQRALGRSLCRQLDTVLERARDELKTDEAPCRVHGDLWSGNRLTDEAGEPWLIDPATVHGHRELDLAMMKLFGGFEPACFDAYTQLAPLPPGSERRSQYYQLYYMLVHVNLHGPSWAGQVAQLAWDLS